MKTLSFGAVEILPSLLDKTKTQTIRPAWRKLTPKEKTFLRNPSIRKTPRFKVGEKVRLYWKQGATPKDSWFCKNCGKIVELYEGLWYHEVPCIKAIKEQEAFPKILGEGVILSIKEIEMVKE